VRTLEWTLRARKDLHALDRQIAQRIYKALQRYLGTGLSDVKQLQGSSNLYRLRVGDWRAVFTLEEGGVHRSEIYR
jgi:mRNA-degrading endonuclease RelE of RelBE toxin-antitoxin system